MSRDDTWFDIEHDVLLLDETNTKGNMCLCVNVYFYYYICDKLFVEVDSY